MTPEQARQVLGLDPDASLDDAVARHRRLQLRHHPDVVGSDDPSATEMSARLNQALAVLRAEAPSTDPPPPAATGPTVEPAIDGPPEVRVECGSLFVAAPADETFLRLLEGGSSIGDIGHIDPRLGLLEILVRPEGGPTCSVLITLQGRALGTEVFCEMESIEAEPTPPFEPVLLALADAVSTADPRPPQDR